jgi:hypothetical protein
VVALVLMGTGATTAQAYNPAVFDAVTGAAVDNGVVSEMVYLNTTGAGWANGVAPTITPTATSLESALSTSTGAASGTSTTAGKVASQWELLRGRVGAGLKVSKLGTIGLAVGAGVVGWKIGSTLRNMFVKVGVPGQGTIPASSLVTVSNVQLVPVDSGATASTSDGGFVAPQDGFIRKFSLTYSSNGTTSTNMGGIVDWDTCGGYAKPTRAMIPLLYASDLKMGGIGSGGCSPEGSKPLYQEFVPEKNLARTKARPLAGADQVDVTTTDTNTRNGATINNNVQNELNNNASDYPELLNWLKANIAHNTEDPTGLTIPSPLSHETYEQYVGRLRAIGFVGTISKATVSDSRVDTARAPLEVITTDPLPGTKWAPDTGIEVQRNPATMPAAGTGTGTASTGDDLVDEPVDPIVPEVDWSPLTNLNLDRFPFAVPGWVAGALGGFEGSDGCPGTAHYGLPYDKSVAINWCLLQPMVDVFRPVFLLASFLALAWMFMGAAMGFGGSGSEATEE